MSAMKCRQTSVKDVPQDEFVVALAAFLKKSGKLKVPDFVDIVKTGKYKELGPYDPDWFYIRCASVARHCYMRAPLGVGGVRKIYGGKKRNGVAPNHFAISSGAVARKALQALTDVNIVESNPDGGRNLSHNGRRVLDRIAAQIRYKTAEPEATE